MFSFIKWFSALFRRLKAHKGAWFTFLTTISLIGIFVSLFFVSFLVGDVAKKTYENQKRHYILHLKNQIALQNEMVLATASAIARDAYLVSLYQSDDQNRSQKIERFAKIIAQSINTRTVTNDYHVSFTESRASQSSNVLNGLNVDTDTLYFMARVPMADNNASRLFVQVRKNAKSLVDAYAKENLACAFFLNDASINKIALNVKKRRFHKFQENYYLEDRLFSQNFIAHLKAIDFKKMLHRGYAKDNAFFYVIRKLYDYDGNEIGLVVVGEHIGEKNSFVNLIKNLVNSVTIVALGLIVSMILFLF